MSMDIDVIFTPLNEFMEWVQDQLAGLGGTGSTGSPQGGTGLPGGTGSAA